MALAFVLGLWAWVEVSGDTAAEVEMVVPDIVVEVRVEVKAGKFAEVDLV